VDEGPGGVITFPTLLGPSGLGVNVESEPSEVAVDREVFPFLLAKATASTTLARVKVGTNIY